MPGTFLSSLNIIKFIQSSQHNHKQVFLVSHFTDEEQVRLYCIY